MRTRIQAVRYALLLIAVVVLMNLLGQNLGFRLDLTDDDRYTLSTATLDIIKDLPEAVTITAYFTEGLPPDLERGRDEFRDMLVEYDRRSNGNVVFEFVDPNTDEAIEQEAQKAGIRPVQVNVREKDKQEVRKAYMGAVVRMGESFTALPLIQANSSMEWELSSAIRKVSVVVKPSLGFVQGHGEPSMNMVPQLLQELTVEYDVEPFTFLDTIPVYDRFEYLLFVNPTDTIPRQHIRWMEDALARGKGIVIAYDAIKSDLGTSPMVEMRHIGLEEWLATKGVRVGQSAITDASCGTVGVMQQRGGFNLQTQVPFPYFPLLKTFPEHPATAGLEAVLLQFCAPLSHDGDSTYVFRPLVTSSEKSNVVPLPLYIDIQKQWTDADFPRGDVAMGATLERKDDPAHGRLAVFTNGSFVLNNMTGGQIMQQNPDNINLLVNTLSWVSDQTGLIELRTKGTRFRPIEEMDEAERTSLKFINVLLPLIAVLVIGLLRWQWRKRQRRARMAPDHVL